jgi:hypothetical protein
MSVRFDAANDRVTRTGGAPDPQSGFTICGWYYVSVNRSDNSTLARIHAASGATTRFNLATDTGGLRPCVFTPGNTGGVQGVDSFTVGAWMWVAVTQTGTTAIIYTCTSVGGTLHSASGASSGGAAPDGYTFGGRSTSDALEWFNGRAQYVRLWSAALNTTELALERDSTIPVKTASLYADYPLSVFTDLTDHSGNTRNLTAGASSTTTEADAPPVSGGTTLLDTLGFVSVGRLTDTAAIGVTLLDAVSSVRAAALTDTAAKGVALTDALGSARLHGGSDTLAIGVAVADVLGTVRASGFAESLAIGVGLADTVGRAMVSSQTDQPASGVVLADQLSTVRAAGSPAETVSNATTLADSTGSVRVQSLTEGLATGVVVSDVLGHVRSAATTDQAAIGVVLTDAAGSVRTAGGVDSTQSGNSLPDVVTGIQVGTTVEQISTGIVLLDVISPVRVASSLETVAAGVVLQDFATRVRAGSTFESVNTALADTVGRVFATAMPMVLVGAIPATQRDLLLYVRATEPKWRVTPVPLSRWSVEPQPSRWTAT